MGKTPSEILQAVAAEGYEFIDLRFCDLPGQVQHFTIPADQLNEDGFDEGFGFDGSSIRGFPIPKDFLSETLVFFTSWK